MKYHLLYIDIELNQIKQSLNNKCINKYANDTNIKIILNDFLNKKFLIQPIE